MENYFLNPYYKKVIPGVSLITAVKNRHEFLEKVLETWYGQNEIDEIIIVDWSSEETLIPLVEKFQNGKIFLAIVPGQEKWILSQAFNLAARLASRSKILKIDADVMILPGFFDKHSLKPGNFYSGNWMLGRDENEKHLNGSVFLYRKDFFKVNGYNEYIKFYGWDDSDLYIRLESLNLKRLDFNLDTLKHIAHEARTTFQDTAGYFKNMTDIEKSNLNILTNKYLCSFLLKWTPENNMLGFNIQMSDNNIWICNQSATDQNVVPDSFYLESETNAINERLRQFEFGIHPDIAQLLKREEFVEYYNLFLSRTIDKTSNDLFNIISKFNYIYSSNIDSKISEINRLAEAFHNRNLEVQQLNEEVWNKKEEIQRLNGEVHQYSVEIQKLNGKTHQSSVKIQQLNKEVHKSRAEIQRLTDETHQSNVEIQRLNGEIHQSSVKIQRLNGEVHQSNVEIQRLNEEVHKSRAEIQRLTDETHQSNVEIQRLNGEIHQSNVEIQRLSEEIHQSSVEIQRLNEEIHQSSVEIQRLRGETHQSSVEIQR
ncbi:MAG: galactosyltransferase-related protein, partial [Bacteroidales bacterium]|nr:galactosyltransferase-related protein [Bacteroidales bacterium]